MCCSCRGQLRQTSSVSDLESTWVVSYARDYGRTCTCTSRKRFRKLGPGILEHRDDVSHNHFAQIRSAFNFCRYFESEA